MTAVFTLLTISIGEEFELKFFKILSCVCNTPMQERSRLTPAGLVGYVCPDVAYCHDEDSETCRLRQDVLRTMFRNRPILEKSQSQGARDHEGVRTVLIRAKILGN